MPRWQFCVMMAFLGWMVLKFFAVPFPQTIHIPLQGWVVIGVLQEPCLWMRFKDAGISPVWSLVSVVPGVGQLAMLVGMFLPTKSEGGEVNRQPTKGYGSFLEGMGWLILLGSTGTAVWALLASEWWVLAFALPPTAGSWCMLAWWKWYSRGGRW